MLYKLFYTEVTKPPGLLTLGPSAAPTAAPTVLVATVAAILPSPATASSLSLPAAAGPLSSPAIASSLSLPAAAGLLSSPANAGPLSPLPPAIAGTSLLSADPDLLLAAASSSFLPVAALQTTVGTCPPSELPTHGPPVVVAAVHKRVTFSDEVDAALNATSAEGTAASDALGGGHIDWERRARVAEMRRAIFPPVAAAPPPPPPHAPRADVREVPAIAGPHPTLTLWDGISEQPIRFHTDQGSAFTVLREADCRMLGLNVVPVSAEYGLPSSLAQANGKDGLSVVGMVRLELHVPNTDTWLTVWAVVVDELFCAFLLGRNVMNVMDGVYGRSSVWDDGGRAMPEAQAGLSAFKATGATAKVCSAGRVMAPACEFDAGEASMRVLGEMWLPESLLLGSEGRRVASVQGVFVGSKDRSSAILFGTTIATANVDWSAAGLIGATRRATVTVDAVAAVSRGSRPQRVRSSRTRTPPFLRSELVCH